jgi:hypothetical protein
VTTPRELGSSSLTAPAPDHELHCDEMNDPAAVFDARRLVASIYLAEGYVEEDDLNESGVLYDHADPYFVHSEYFAVGVGPSLNPLLAVSRLVLYDEDRGVDSFPMLTGMELDDDFLATVAAADLTTWAEVGSMAKAPGASVQAPNLLYRKMWQRAVRGGHATWLCAADHRVSRTLRNLFGEEIRLVGPRQHFMGSPTDPMIMHPPTSADWLAQQAADSADDDSMVSQLVRLALAFFLDGLEPDYFTERQLDRFEAGGVNLRDQVVIDLRGDEPTVELRE